MKRLFCLFSLFVFTTISIYGQDVVEMTFPELTKDNYVGSLKPSPGNHFVVCFNLKDKDNLKVTLYEVNNTNSSKETVKEFDFKLDNLFLDGGGYNTTIGDVYYTVILLKDKESCGFLINESRKDLQGDWKTFDALSFSYADIRKKKENKNSPYIESVENYISKITKIDEFLISKAKFPF